MYKSAARNGSVDRAQMVVQDADFSLQEEAADEIERLRAEVSALHRLAKLLLREEARRG